MATGVNKNNLDAEDRQMRENILAELRKYREELKTGERPFLNGRGKVMDLIRQWKDLRPKMVARLKKMGILKEYALVCLERRDDKLMSLRRAGMMETDAREEANQGLLLWDEADDEPEEMITDPEELEALAMLML